MALILTPTAAAALSPEEALSLAREQITRCSFESLADNAAILAGLAANRAFLSAILNADLRHAFSGGKTHIYTHQCLILAQDQDYALRANFWVPPTKYLERSELEKELYSYELAHDHNFDFITIGYLGPGYATDLFEYDRSSVQGFIGEPVDLEFVATERLEPGRVIGFKGGKDVHVQYYPSEFSVSLNLLLRDKDQQTLPQYYFDVSEKKISGYVENSLTSRLSVLRFAKYVGDAETTDLLGSLVRKLDQPLLRAGAYDALLGRVDGEAREDLLFEIGRDPDPLLQARMDAVSRFRP
jgi:hypothetical protein